MGCKNCGVDCGGACHVQADTASIFAATGLPSAAKRGDDSNCGTANTEGTPCAIYPPGVDPCNAERRFEAVKMGEITLTEGEPVFLTDENDVVTHVGRRWLLIFPRSMELCLTDIVASGLPVGGSIDTGALQRTVIRTLANFGWRTFILPALEGALRRFNITVGRCFCEELCSPGQPIVALPWSGGGVAFTAWGPPGQDLTGLVISAHTNSKRTLPEPIDCRANETTCDLEQLACAKEVRLGAVRKAQCGLPPPPPP